MAGDCKKGGEVTRKGRRLNFVLEATDRQGCVILDVSDFIFRILIAATFYKNACCIA